MPTIADIVVLSTVAKASTASKPHQALTVSEPVNAVRYAVSSAATAPSVSAMSGQQAVSIASADEPTIGRLLLSPYRVDAGFVLTDKDLSITAWNSDYVRALSITSVENTDPDALRLTGSQARRLAPGAATKYAVQLRVVGKSILDDSLRFVVAELGVDSPAVRIFGTRLVVFPLAPDWSAGFDEQLTHATSILTSHSGVEQRAMLREAPVRALTFTVSAMDDAEAGQLEALLWAWQSRIFGVPVWSDERTLTAPATAGSTTVYCDTSYSEMKAGGYALVWSDSFTFDAVQISAVQSDRVVLAFPLTKAYPRGAKVLPISFARLDEQLTVQHDAAAVSTAQLTFTVE